MAGLRVQLIHFSYAVSKEKQRSGSYDFIQFFLHILLHYFLETIYNNGKKSVTIFINNYQHYSFFHIKVDKLKKT